MQVIENDRKYVFDPASLMITGTKYLAGKREFPTLGVPHFIHW